MNPEYLAWYINQTPAQNFIQSHARGSGILLMPKKDFQEMEIDLPPLETQHSIVKLDRLQQKEKRLLQELAEKRSQLIQAVCLKAAKQSAPK